ncbi:class I SAM-dependent DNA methyltransferase [Bdellovibrio sp. GT3]|uniref:class I SAM-dependent DNA methyltransferase n=1 Tax=Bdellovibrio sp. GT3 TaxID=3136282 RepID=UPI0030F16C33
MKHFDQNTANQYDHDIRLRIPGYNLIQELISAVLDVEVPTSARMLVVGSGTGEEIVRVASRYSGWRIDGIEPSAEMNRIAAQKTGIYKSQNQIHLHEAKIEDFTSTEGYDVALSVFVSHFLPDDGSKLQFFKKVATHLKPGALFVFADMMKQSDSVGEIFIASNYYWAKTQGLEMPQLRDLPGRLRNLFHPMDENRMREIFTEVGFKIEGRFAQSLGYSGYVARKTVSK